NQTTTLMEGFSGEELKDVMPYLGLQPGQTETRSIPPQTGIQSPWTITEQPMIWHPDGTLEPIQPLPTEGPQPVSDPALPPSPSTPGLLEPPAPAPPDS